jgi:hypothetical protein
VGMGSGSDLRLTVHSDSVWTSSGPFRAANGS